jgi:hypothetical protein
MTTKMYVWGRPQQTLEAYGQPEQRTKRRPSSRASQCAAGFRSITNNEKRKLMPGPQPECGREFVLRTLSGAVLQTHGISFHSCYRAAARAGQNATKQAA